MIRSPLFTLSHPARLLGAAALCAAMPVLAQQPADLQPIPEPPLPAVPVSPNDASLEPQVTIRQQEDNTVEEWRLNGQLYMVRVTPRGGIPFTLTAPPLSGVAPQTVDFGPEVRPPMWTIFSW